MINFLSQYKSFDKLEKLFKKTVLSKTGIKYDKDYFTKATGQTLSHSTRYTEI